MKKENFQYSEATDELFLPKGILFFSTSNFFNSICRTQTKFPGG